MMWTPWFSRGGRRTLLCLLPVLLLAAPAVAQNTGTISGVIVDNTGQVVPGATVTLVNEATTDSRTATSGDHGDFAFRAVEPGSYTVKVELTGFRLLERRNNVLNANGRLDLGNLKLEVGALTELVTVAASGTQIETKNSDYSGLLTATQISQIQSRGRDVVNLLRLLPGVHYENDIEAMGDSFGSTIPNIGGQRKNWNQVSLDGLNGNELSGTNRMNSSINLDAIAEVKVLLNSYKAEFGHTGGANIQIVTKSGSSDYHGSGYWYGKRDAWNASPWENNRTNVAKPTLHIDTPGFNLGGPVKIPRVYDQGSDKKLFFFYSFEAPQVQKPGPLRLYRMPTAAERQGDFSQTFDSNGRLIFIKDPLSSGACSATTGGPGCFPGNVIPANRLDPNALALLNMLPLPNALGQSPNYNFTRQETADNPRFNNLLRVDMRPSGNNSIWGTFRTFKSSQYGSEITAGPAKWGFFNGSYVSGDNGLNGGWNHISKNSVNELQIGIRRATEGFGVKDDSDYNRLLKTNIGYNLSQFHPELNTIGTIPQITFGVSTTGTTSPDFTYDSRLGSTAYDWLSDMNDTFTWTHGHHTFKLGGYFELMRNNEARGGTWYGQFQFNNSSSNPLNTNFAFSNAVLGVFSQYTETDQYRKTQNRQWWSEWYGQDTWQLNSRMTFDYGLRFLYYSPYQRPDGQVSNFDPSKYDPSKAPRLYYPATVNGTKVGLDRTTGQTVNQIYIGTFVPGTGDPANGFVKETDPGVPMGFREVLAPQPEPRIGFTWDISGLGTTVLHSSAGLFHQARLGGGSLGNLAANPPFIHNPVVFNGTMSTLFAPGVTLADRPSTVEALETNYKTPSSYNWSIGVRREIGWGTAIDATYTGYSSRNMEMYYDLNAVPDGARNLTLHPENADPTSPTTALSADFLRPYRGVGSIRVRGNSATGDSQALQLQVNRRYIHGVQFGAAYTLQRARGYADEDPGNLSTSLNRPGSWYFGELAQSNRQSLIVNYTWDLPRGSRGVLNNAIGRLALDGWQLSGENDFVTGDWADVILTTSDNFDFTGGDGGNGGCLAGSDPCAHVVRPVLIGNPTAGGGDPLTGWFNTAAFARPSGFGDYGNAPRNVVQKPGVVNWNLALFKNFAAGGHRSFQFRAEAYNVLNHTEFQDIDRTARFDTSGNQINPSFATGIGISSPTRPPRTIQLSARFSF